MHRLQLGSVAETIFDSPEGRPEPAAMSQLIADGLDKHTIIAAGELRGLTPPTMERTLQDLETILPHLTHFMQELVDRHGDTTIISAACDADILYDLAIAYPDLDIIRLPASQPLIYSSLLRNPNIARRFLTQFRLGQNVISNTGKQFTFLDCGYEGSVGEVGFANIAEKAYGHTALKAGRMAIALVSAVPYVRDRQLVDFGIDWEALGPRSLPKVWSGWISGKESYLQSYGSNSLIATAMQLMPRYHGHFVGMDSSTDPMLPLFATTGPIPDTVDSPPHGFANENATIVHPLAAAIVQYRTVLAATA